ncbi:MAG: hypothetical protein Q9184_004036 [Pyrenodesmia sp. 2 TL-2023]
MQIGSRGSPLLRSQTSLLVFLTPSLASTPTFAAAHPCRTYLAIANLSLAKRLPSASNAPRHASSAAAAAAQQPSPDGDGAASRPQPLLRPRPARSPEEIKSRQTTLLDRIRNASKPQDALGTKEARDRKIDSLLGKGDDITRYNTGSPSGEHEDTASWTERTIAEHRAAQRRKEYELAQKERDRQDGRQGKIIRGMRMPPTDHIAIQQQHTVETAEATRAAATIKSRPSLGRAIEVFPDRGMDLGRALKNLEVECALNNVRKDAIRQRFHERPGLKRKRLKSERWRRRFKIGFRAVVAKALRPPLRGPPKFRSLASDGHVYQVNNLPSQQLVPPTPATLSPDSAALKRTSTKTRASLDSRASRTSSNASSLAKRALRLINRPSGSASPSAKPARTSSKSARGGHVWKRQISGHWLEIRVGKGLETPTKPPDTDPQERPQGLVPAPPTGPDAARRGTRTSDPSRGRMPLRPSSTKSQESSSAEEKPKESLVTRTKRKLGISNSTSTLPSRISTPSLHQSETGKVLDRASTALRDYVDKHKLTPPSGSTSTSNVSALSAGGKSKRQRRGLFRPGYRRQKTGHSSSSSVRRIMFGKAPASTPDVDSMYTGSDRQQYFRVELTDANAPTYLPSEARRIGTPPLPGENSKLRGFFFDYNAPMSTREQSEGVWPNAPMNAAPLPHRQQGLRSPGQRFMPSRSPGGRTVQDVMDVDWFRVAVAMDAEKREKERFELNVPDHLPSSPLCPKHPKHKSGGKGVCVYHGRNKTGTDDVGDEGMGWR